MYSSQGLVYHKDGYFIEGTGLYGQSQLQKVNASTGKVMQYKTLDRQYFGEYVVLRSLASHAYTHTFYPLFLLLFCVCACRRFFNS